MREPRFPSLPGRGSDGSAGAEWLDTTVLGLGFPPCLDPAAHPPPPGLHFLVETFPTPFKLASDRVLSNFQGAWPYGDPAWTAVVPQEPISG